MLGPAIQMLIVESVDELACEQVWRAAAREDPGRAGTGESVRVFGKAGEKLYVECQDLEAVFCRFVTKFTDLTFGEEMSQQLERDNCKLEFILQAI